jgi:hypothetical protein
VAAKQKEQVEGQAKAVKKFNDNAKDLRTTYEDFDEVIEAPVFTPTMRSVLLTSDTGPNMAYYLGRPENIQVAQRIANLPPELQPYEIGRLETQLQVAAKTKKLSQTPAPITPVGGMTSAKIDESKLSDDEWYALEKERQKAKLKAKYGG